MTFLIHTKGLLQILINKKEYVRTESSKEIKGVLVLKQALHREDVSLCLIKHHAMKTCGGRSWYILRHHPRREGPKKTYSQNSRISLI
jgi:hypothetical protein